MIIIDVRLFLQISTGIVFYYHQPERGQTMKRSQKCIYSLLFLALLGAGYVSAQQIQNYNSQSDTHRGATTVATSSISILADSIPQCPILDSLSLGCDGVDSLGHRLYTYQFLVQNGSCAGAMLYISSPQGSLNPNSFSVPLGVSSFNGILSTTASAGANIIIYGAIPACDSMCIDTMTSILPVCDTTVGVRDIGYLPEKVELMQCYPNPFNPTATIRFRIAKSGFTTLKVYDALGRIVSTLVNEILLPGTYERTFDAKGLVSGIYFYRLQVGNFVETKKLVLLR
jgi:hypothetical protein